MFCLVSVVWCGVVWCGVVWCGVVWCTVVLCSVAHLIGSGLSRKGLMEHMQYYKVVYELQQHAIKQDELSCSATKRCIHLQ